MCECRLVQLSSDGDISDGDISDGDISDGDISDGDISDGDISDGDISDGDISDGDISDVCAHLLPMGRQGMCDFRLSRCSLSEKQSGILTQSMDHCQL